MLYLNFMRCASDQWGDFMGGIVTMGHLTERGVRLVVEAFEVDDVAHVDGASQGKRSRQIFVTEEL